MKIDKKPPSENPIKKWIAENYGVISRISREFGVSPAHAHYVAFGVRQSRDLRIERALKALGCPIARKLN